MELERSFTDQIELAKFNIKVEYFLKLHIAKFNIKVAYFIKLHNAKFNIKVAYFKVTNWEV